MKTSFSPFLKIIKQTSLFVLTGILFSMLICACSTRRTYFGEELDKDQVAIVKPVKKVFTDVDIRSLDGYQLGYFDDSFAVLPGTHTMKIHVMMDYPALHGNLQFYMKLSFDAEAGHTYGVYATILPMSNEGFVWIESDQAPGKVVVKKYADFVELINTSGS
jgi:hypothetical protein